jgi:hypothetical protein
MPAGRSRVAELVPALLLGAAVLLVALGMTLSWRRRQRRGAGLGAPAPAPAALGEVLAAAEVLYVATTHAGEPLERIAVRGLGFRARGSALVHPEGVVLDLDGSEPVILPAAGLEVGRATWAIDRVVEPDGLILLGWTLGATRVETALRTPDPAAGRALEAAARSIIASSDSVPEGELEQPRDRGESETS